MLKQQIQDSPLPTTQPKPQQCNHLSFIAVVTPATFYFLVDTPCSFHEIATNNPGETACSRYCRLSCRSLPLLLRRLLYPTLVQQARKNSLIWYRTQQALKSTGATCGKRFPGTSPWVTVCCILFLSQA